MAGARCGRACGSRVQIGGDGSGWCGVGGVVWGGANTLAFKLNRCAAYGAEKTRMALLACPSAVRVMARPNCKLTILTIWFCRGLSTR